MLFLLASTYVTLIFLSTVGFEARPPRLGRRRGRGGPSATAAAQAKGGDFLDAHMFGSAKRPKQPRVSTVGFEARPPRRGHRRGRGGASASAAAAKGGDLFDAHMFGSAKRPKIPRLSTVGFEARTVSLLAGLLAGYVNDKALQLEGGRKENPCCGCIPCWVAKGVFCSPCALCQASNRLARLDKVKAGSSWNNKSFVAPRAKMMAL